MGFFSFEIGQVRVASRGIRLKDGATLLA